MIGHGHVSVQARRANKTIRMRRSCLLVGLCSHLAFVGLRVDAGFLLVFLPLPFAFALGLAAGFAFGVVGAAEAARFPMAALARWPRHAKAAIPTLCWIGVRAKVNESGHYSMVFRVIPK